MFPNTVGINGEAVISLDFFPDIFPTLMVNNENSHFVNYQYISKLFSTYIQELALANMKWLRTRTGQTCCPI